MAAIGAVVAAWGLSALWRDRSPAAVWRQPPLLLAAAGGTVTLAAAPIDAAWHARFGRDAVLWSPPHMLAIFGSLALLVGFLAGARPATPRWILTGLGALLLGSAAVPVLEFETDVPQFSETLYLPVLLATTLFAAWVLRQVIPGPLPVARARSGSMCCCGWPSPSAWPPWADPPPTCPWRSSVWPRSTCHGGRPPPATPAARPASRSSCWPPAPPGWPASILARWLS